MYSAEKLINMRNAITDLLIVIMENLFSRIISLPSRFQQKASSEKVKLLNDDRQNHNNYKKGLLSRPNRKE